MARSARPPPASNVVELPKKKPSSIVWRTLAAAARLLPRRSRETGAQVVDYRPNPFTPAVPFPGVVGKDAEGNQLKSLPPKIAMDAADAWKGAMDDAAFPVAGNWLGGYGAQYAYSAYAEGQEWLGYAVLAILSQRPEYRTITGTFALDMTREWIEFKSKSEDRDKQPRIDELVARLEELKLKEVVHAGILNDGFQGRGQIYVDTGHEDDPNELKTSIGYGGKDTLAKFGSRREEDQAGDGMARDLATGSTEHDAERRAGGGKKYIRRLAAIEPMWCYPAQYNASDPLRADWYRPDTWWVMGKEVHRSRLLTFVSNPVPDMLKPAYSFGGLSRTQMSKPYVDFYLRNRTSSSDLLNNFSMRVLATDLSVTTMDEGSELLQRVATMNVLADNQSTMVINKDSEEFTVAAAPLGGVKDLVAQSAEHMCAPSRIPIVKFFGNQPSGLNADSEGVIRMWYDNVHAEQENILRAPIQTIVNHAMIELWGEVDDDITFEFVDLWQLDAAGKAAIQKTKSDQRAVDIEAGIISPEEGRMSAARDPDSQYAGLDLHKPLPEPELEPDLLGPEATGEGEEETGTAAERGEVRHPPGIRPSRRDFAPGLTSAAAKFGGAVTGGFSAKE